MKAPTNELTTNWYDRKGNYFMTLQDIVEATMRFCDIHVGFPSPTNDKRVLQNSYFFWLAEANKKLNGPSFTGRGYNIREYIIGDGGYYELLPWLLIRFQAPLSMSKAHSIRAPDINRVPKTIATCCILHNMDGLVVAYAVVDEALE